MTCSNPSAPTADRVPPHSVEAEQGVLGCILSEQTCFDDCQARLKAGSRVFYDVRNREIYEAMGQLRAQGKAIDVITLQSHLRDKDLLESAGGLSYLAALPDTIPSPANLPYYLDILLEKYRLRRLVATCAKVVTEAQACERDVDGLLARVQAACNELDDDDERQLDSKGCAEVMLNDLERRLALKGKRSGLCTGFAGLDSLTDGLQFGEQTVIGARPSAGKTALACNIVERVCLRDGIPTAFISLEMSPAALMKRMLSSWASIPMRAIKSGVLTEKELDQVHNFTRLVVSGPLFIEDGVGGMNANQVVGAVRRLCRKHGVKLVVIDYLQKIKPVTRHEKRTYEVGEVSGMLKALAVQTGVALVTIAQLNREPSKDKQRAPQVSDLADSSQIERDADTVALLHRPDRAESPTKLIIAKQRDGECGVVELVFDGVCCRFENSPQDTPC